MPAAWQATGTLLGSTGADITPTNPSHVKDDVLILHAWARTTGITMVTPSGWDTLHDIDFGTRHWWFWKRALAAGTTNPLCDFSSATGDKYAVVHCFRGCVDVGNPYFGAAIVDYLATTGSGSPANPGGAEGPQNSLAVMMGFSSDNLVTAISTIATDPATLTQRSVTSVSTGSDSTQFIATGLKSATGNTGLTTVSFTGAPSNWGTLLICLISLGVPPLHVAPHVPA
jgi:hypothetical protein